MRIISHIGVRREPIMSDIRATKRTTLKRLPKRGDFDRDTVNAILDEGLVCHLAFEYEGKPAVIPTSYVRDDDKLYIHGSRKSRALLMAAGNDVCFSVTLLDGLVLARSVFHHSINYRSVVVYGKAQEVTHAEERRRALRLLVDHIVPGRSAEAREPNAKEMAATLVIKLPLDECSAKVRTGPPVDDEPDMALPVWAGVIPVNTGFGPPEADPQLADGIAAPEYVTNYKR